MTLAYLYSKFFKVVLRGKSVLRSQIDKTAYVGSGTLLYDSSIGKYSYMGYDCEVVNCEIGKFCSLANNVIIGGAQHPLNWVSTSPVFYNQQGGSNHHLGSLEFDKTKRSYIGNDVWIGNRAIIMQGIRIGDGAVIGAGAVITKDVPPYAIVGGIPARIIRYRFDEQTIAELQQSQWWNLSDDMLRQYSQYMNNPTEFCNILKGK